MILPALFLLMGGTTTAVGICMHQKEDVNSRASMALITSGLLFLAISLAWSGFIIGRAL